MPYAIMKEYRLVYRNAYMQQTLDAQPGTKLRVQAFLNNGLGFPGHFIWVNFNGPRDHEIWASNIIKNTGDGTLEGIINVNPDLLKESKEQRKLVLAEEWLEVMLGFRDREVRGRRRQRKEDTDQFLYKLTRSVPWQDSPDEFLMILSALRYLLVSEESLNDTLKDLFHFQSMSAIGIIAKTDRRVAEQITISLAGAFSTKWSVDKKLVLNRILEAL